MLRLLFSCLLLFCYLVFTYLLIFCVVISENIEWRRWRGNNYCDQTGFAWRGKKKMYYCLRCMTSLEIVWEGGKVLSLFFSSVFQFCSFSLIDIPPPHTHTSTSCLLRKCKNYSEALFFCVLFPAAFLPTLYFILLPTKLLPFSSPFKGFVSARWKFFEAIISLSVRCSEVQMMKVKECMNIFFLRPTKILLLLLLS